MSERRRVLMVQPSLQPPGGGNAVAAWMIQALKDHHDLSVLTWRPVELDPMNAYYGTSIRPGDIRSRAVPAAWRRVVDALPTAAVLLKASLLFRYAKGVVDDYDVIVCGHNETDLGGRCLQYVHYPARLRPRPAVDLRWFHFSFLLAPYYALCERLARFEPDKVQEAITIANSSWTANLVDRLYGLGRRVRVVHPPVATDIQGRPWEGRDDGFVCIGRLAPEKELERVMDIIAGVREQVPAAHLHIIGSRGPESYHRRITAHARRLGDWITIHEDVSRATLFELIGSHRYAIHGMREEHFGIAPAEAVSGGCITFIPNAGGQVDIAGDEPRLLYGTEADAVTKIVAVMRDPAAQAALRTHLIARRERFSTERFMTTVRALVEEIAARRAEAARPRSG